MTLSEREFTVHELRYATLKQDAEQRRLRHEALGLSSDLPRPCCVALFWLGCRLVAMGARLQAKFGQAIESERKTTTPLHPSHSL